MIVDERTGVAAPAPPGPRGAGRVVLAWVVTRVALVVAPGVIGRSYRLQVAGDAALYRRWAAGMVHGQLPLHDESWQYPPGAAVVLWLPRQLGGFAGYHGWFVAEMVLADLAVFAVVCTAARSGGSWRGAWYWVAALPAMGPLAYNRFDLVPAALAVAGMAAAAGRRPGSHEARRPGDRPLPALAGLWLGLGALVKVWPGLLLPLVRRPAGLGAPVTAVLAALVPTAVSLGALGVSGQLTPGLEFLRHEGGRGLQLEAVAATPFDLLRMTGGGPEVVHRYGAFELAGAGTAHAVTVAGALTAVSLAVYGGLWLRSLRRRVSPDGVPTALAVVLAVTVFARVLSPQYLVWLLALAAFELSRRRCRCAGPAALILLATLLGQGFFPLGYHYLKAGAVGQTLVLTARNVLLLAALAWTARRAWQAEMAAT